MAISREFSEEASKGLPSIINKREDIEPEIELIIPDFIEIEPQKTRMYKIITEGYCYKSPEYSLSWKVRPCKVDLSLKSPFLEKRDQRSENYIKQEATIHTLKYTRREDLTNGFDHRVSYNYRPKVDDYYNSEDRNTEYMPPEMYNLGSETESTKSSNDIQRVNNLDELRHYIQTNMV